MSERVHKILARAGVASRRRCEELIEDGRVAVNGVVVGLGAQLDVSRDIVTIDGAFVPLAPDAVYYVLNKPAGYVTTAHDPEGRPTVVDLVPPEPRVFPVGRLDLDTEGLLLLTNDGELTHRLTHPSFGIEKEYLAEVEGTPTRGTLRRLREGVELEDGLTAPAKVALVHPHLLRLAIHEGRNRQVRRMCAAVGHPVVRLVRVRIASLVTGTLAPGQWRPLDGDEVRALAAAAAAPTAGPPPRDR
ncbi:MAG: pseudouridine synthase [Acidimicrobiales bacterium]